MSDTEDDMAAGAQLYESFLEKQMYYSKGGIMKIAEIHKTKDGVVLTELITAKVSNVGLRKTGRSQLGKSWSLQPIFLKDDTGDIQMVAWGRDDLSKFQDYIITVGATKSDRGWGGCQVKDHEYPKGTITKQITLNHNGLLKVKGVESSPSRSESSITNLPPPSTNGPIDYWIYIEAMKAIHSIAMDLEPNDGVARAALVNTAMIAYTNGKIKFEIPEPPQEEEPPLPPEEPPTRSDDLDDIPF